MRYAIAGWPGTDCLEESLLDTIISRIKAAARRLAEILNQSGNPL